MNTFLVTANGPIYADGRIVVRHGDRILATGELVALCRCGASRNKPFCDNSHLAAGFTDNCALPVAKAPPPGTVLTDPVCVVPTKDGPLQCTGPMLLHDAAGTGVFVEATYLCRCGASHNKPFCDGTHRKIGFTD
jgi:CDGSH-type Zn-finger protein